MKKLVLVLCVFISFVTFSQKKSDIIFKIKGDIFLDSSYQDLDITIYKDNKDSTDIVLISINNMGYVYKGKNTNLTESKYKTYWSFISVDNNKANNGSLEIDRLKQKLTLIQNGINYRIRVKKFKAL